MNLAPATAWRFPIAEFQLPNDNTPIGNRQSVIGNAQEVAVASLQLNDVILIRPGDRVPIDGVVVDGKSSVDESMITGESLPVTRNIDDNVVGGTINHDGALKVRVTRIGSQTALAQIIQLVEKAQSSKPAVQRLADKIASIFVPCVLAIALITGVGWYLRGQSQDWTTGAIWAQIAKTVCSVLIIACPCALGLAVPAALMVGTGRGAKRGILIRDIDALQNAEKINTVVLDKTGTITRGKPVVTGIQPLDGLAENALLQLAAGAEQYSQHPLAQAIVASARARGLEIPRAGDFSSRTGEGVAATIDGRTILVGSDLMMNGAPHASGTPVTGSIVHVGEKNGEGVVARLGRIVLSDEIKPDSIDAVSAIHALNLQTVLLTGDNRATADAIAKQVGIDDVRAEVKPDQKAATIRELQSRPSSIAMVGDGINDAPALAQSDLGIAIGSGSDIAKETGDIGLVGGSLAGIATAIRLSRATMRTVRQNLFFAFIYNVLAIPLAAFGYATPLIAAAAMALSDVTVIGNALLLRRAKID
jgi:Cu+-exporting ATPase